MKPITIDALSDEILFELDDAAISARRVGVICDALQDVVHEEKKLTLSEQMQQWAEMFEEQVLEERNEEDVNRGCVTSGLKISSSTNSLTR